MSGAGPCDNPMCSCDPCGCDDCKCGVARLGDLERRVMGILWESGDNEVSVRDVSEALPEYAYTTVATVLDRLVHKGMLKRRMAGRTIRFTTIGSQGAHTAVLMHKVLDEEGDSEAALLRFAEGLSDAEAVVLRRALDDVVPAAHRDSA
jgi:predicted transcriptional regulator